MKLTIVLALVSLLAGLEASRSRSDQTVAVTSGAAETRIAMVTHAHDRPLDRAAPGVPTRENDLRNPISPHNRGIEPSRIEKLHYDAIPMPLPTSAPAGRVVNELDLELRV